jgi:hypothetical protein
VVRKTSSPVRNVPTAMEDWFPYEEGAVVAPQARKRLRVEWSATAGRRRTPPVMGQPIHPSGAHASLLPADLPGSGTVDGGPATGSAPGS